MSSLLRAAILFFSIASLMASFSIAVPLPQQLTMKLTIYLLLKNTVDLLFFWEHKLCEFPKVYRALRASYPTCSRASRASRALHALCLTCLVPYVLLCLTCLTCSCTSHVLCLACSQAACALNST